MKKHLTFGALALVTGWTALAGPLQRQHLAADTQWVLHFDTEAFLKTHLGDTMAREQIDPKMTKARADLKAWFDFDLDWRRISGVTIYGTDYTSPESQRGVVVVYTDMDFAQGLDGAIGKLEAAGAAEAGSVKHLGEGLYEVKEAVVATEPGFGLVLGKSKDKVLQAREVIHGRSPNLQAGPAFSQFPAAAGGFFFLGAAEGFSLNASLPPQANVLKMADGLQLTLGESGPNLVANLGLLARDAQVSQQIQQVVQGLIALVSLSQTENPEAQQLARGLQVRQAERLVSIELALPLEQVFRKIAEKTSSQSAP